jgi:sulfite reductase alpha subunit-like flavoprotein
LFKEEMEDYKIKGIIKEYVVVYSRKGENKEYV